MEQSGKASSGKWGLIAPPTMGPCEDRWTKMWKMNPFWNGLAFIQGSENGGLEFSQLPKLQKPLITLYCVAWESLTSHALLLRPPTRKYYPELLELTLPSRPALLGLPSHHCSILLQWGGYRFWISRTTHLSLFLLHASLSNKGQFWLL